MPLPGGATDKLGNSYELTWTANCLVEVIGGEADAIRLEPPGAEGKGVEFWLDRGASREYHQVKRQQAGKGKWSISNLAEVLANFRYHLQADPGSRCVFISTEKAPELAELIDRAERSASVQEFVGPLLEPKGLKQAFVELCSRWGGCDDGTAWVLLRRIVARAVDDRTLEDLTIGRLAPLVGGNAASVVATLRSHAIESVHGILRATDLWEHLRSRGYQPTQWGRDQSVAVAVHDETERYVDGEASPISSIARNEAGQVVAAFASDDAPQRIVFLTGEAGSGKSHVAAQVAEQLQSLGWPVLAFRLDRQPVVARPEQLASGLNLPGSPAAVLAAVAHGNDSLLVVDQLDTVSTVSGRSPEFFHCFGQLLRQALAHPRLRVLIVCRSFDLDNDSNLRELRFRYQTAPVIPVGRLSSSQVREAMAELGLDPSALSEKQVELLSLPLHLVLLAQSRPEAGGGMPTFSTAIELFDLFWNRKRQDIRTHSGRQVRWSEIIGRLCDEMSRQQSLSVQRDRLLDLEEDRDAMVSEHVLRQDGQRISFFHESFFDYAYARVLLSRNGRLRDLVLDGEQHLFRRAQVRQLLAYQRARGDQAGFVGDIRWLLTAKGVRFHLRQTGLLVLAGLPEPSPTEWELVRQLMAGPNAALATWARRVVVGSPGWLRLLHDNGVLRGWLVSEGSDRDLALSILRRWAGEEPDRVAVLLEPWIEGGQAWHNGLWSVLGWPGELIQHDRLWQLVRPLLEISEPPQHIMHRWVEVAPERCCEALALRTQRLIQVHPEGSVLEGSRFDYPYMEAAKAVPGKYLAYLGKLVLDLVEGYPSQRHGERTPCWDQFGWHGGSDYREVDTFFEATATALGQLASDDEPSFRAHVQAFAQTDWLTAHIIVTEAFTRAGASAAPAASTYMRDVFDRFDVGEDEGFVWPLCEAIRATAPYWSDGDISYVAGRIMSVHPSRERSVYGYRWRGRPQRLLLEALPESRLPRPARLRLREWRDKPGTEAGERPYRVRGGFVEAPLPEPTTLRMNNRSWLNAICRYSTDEERVWSGDRIFGGSWQLSQSLQERVKEDPERFAALCLALPENVNSHYLDAVLNGVAEASGVLKADFLLAILRRCHEAPGHPCGRSIARLVAKYADQGVGTDIIEIVRWYALNDPDPEHEVSRENASSGKPYYSGDLHFHGINTVRGGIAGAISSLLFANFEHRGVLSDACERLVRDPIIAVRSCVAEICTALLLRSPDHAVTLFQALVDCDEAILKTRPVEHFLQYSLRDRFSALRSILDRMVTSSDDEIAQAGARRACLAAFDNPEALPFAERVLAGGVPLRRGAAEVYSTNLLIGPDRAHYEAALRSLFWDEDENVRAEAVRFLRRVGASEEVAELEPLLRDLIESPAFEKAQGGLFRLLDQTWARVPDLLFLAVERFLAISADAARDVRTGAAATANEASTLLIRAYSQTNDDKLRKRCLDLIDNLLKQESFGVERALEDLSR